MENICFRVLLCTFSVFLLAHFLYFETYHSTFEVLTLKQLRRLSLNRVVPWLTKNHFERDRCWMLKLYHSRCFLMYVFFVFDLVPRIVSPFLACVFVVRFKVSLCSQGNPEEEEHSDHRWNFEAASPKMRCDDFQVISILVSFEFRSAERRVERLKKFHSTQNDVQHSLSNACYLFEPGRISTRLSNCCLFQLTSAQTKHRHVHSFFRLKSLDEYTFLYVHGVWKQVNRFCPVVPRTKSAFAHLPPCKHYSLPQVPTICRTAESLFDGSSVLREMLPHAIGDRVSATFNHLHIFAFSVTWAWADVVCLPVQFGPS